MKNKKLLLGASAIALTIAALIFAPAYFDSTKEHADRGEKKEEYKGIAGAMQYYWERKRNIKTGKIEISDILKADRAVEVFAKNQSKSSAALNLSWEEMGPDNVGGRTRAILFDKDDPNRMYAGAVSGGLWMSYSTSTDDSLGWGGVTWVKITTQLAPDDNLAVTCITQAANGDIYVGTGESFAGSGGYGGGYGTTAFIGKGIWKSTDGINFNRLPSTVPTDTNSGGTWAFVNRLAADPVNANKIYAAINQGLRVSYNGGDSWSTAKYCADPPTCSVNIPLGNIKDVRVGSDGSVFASSASSVYYSATGDTGSFTVINTNFPDNLSGAQRIELAIAPSDPDYIYCVATKGDGSLLNIYQSTDKGQSWTIIAPGGSSFNPHRSQGGYNNALAVFPDDPEHILVGGVELWGLSTRTGVRARIAVGGNCSFCVHVDHHTFVFHPQYGEVINGIKNETIFFGNDGGIYRSVDGGSTFQEMNKNYMVTQFYAVGFSRDGAVAGGTQDNGNPYIDGTGNTPLSEVYNLLSGDGGYVQISTINPDAFFWESQNGSERRSPNKGPGGSSFFPDADGGAWVTPFLLWESFNDLNSNDSVTFYNFFYQQIAIGDSVLSSFSGTLDINATQPSAKLSKGSIVFTNSMPAQTIFDDGFGIFIGDGTGTIDYNTGVFTINFNNVPFKYSLIQAAFDTEFDAGDTIVLESNNKVSNDIGYPFNYITPVDINPGDNLMIQDIVQSKFFVGISSGVWMAKDVLDFSKYPEWYKLSTAGGAVCMGYSNDGDVLFVGISNTIRRISGVLSIVAGDPSTSFYTPAPVPPPGIISTTISIPGGQVVTGISVDPNDANNVVVTLGNYGSTNHVYRSTNALGAATFTSIQNNLPPMPVYDAVIDKTDPNRIIIGTEYGIYGTDNGFDAVPGNVVWTEENTGMARVPTYMVSQQWLNNNTCTGVTNSGVIYIGTHGRGIFKCSTFADPQATPVNICNVGEISGIDNTLVVSNNLSGLKVYPNPLSNGKGNISFNLDKGSDVTVKIFDLRGRVIKAIDMGKQTAGTHIVSFDSNDFGAGTYLVSIVAGEFRKAAKFVVVK